MAFKVVVISPNPFSRYTLSTLYLLEREGIEVTAVISVKLMNLKRFVGEFKRDGFRLIRKIYRKLILKSSENSLEGVETIVSYMQEQGMPFVSVPAYCKDRDIEFFSIDKLNHPSVHALLERHKPDCIPYTGGGLIRQDIIDRAGRGVINCHMGVLPYYRGMDVVQWPVLNDDFQEIGMTAHIIDKGIDTGDILQIVKIDPSGHRNLGSLRNSFEIKMPEVLVDSCARLLRGEISPTPQEPKAGTQHFIINSRLSPLVDHLLKQQI